MQHLSRQRGFTLIELVIVIVLLGMLSVIASTILSQGLNAFLQGQNIINANWQGQLMMARMTRDIDKVRSANDIITFTGNEFAFVDINGNSIDYKLSGTSLMNNTQVLADGINNLVFSYYDASGIANPTAANIHYVKVATNITQNNTNYNLQASVYLRNLSF